MARWYPLFTQNVASLHAKIMPVVESFLNSGGNSDTYKKVMEMLIQDLRDGEAPPYDVLGSWQLNRYGGTLKDYRRYLDKIQDPRTFFSYYGATDYTLTEYICLICSSSSTRFEYEVIEQAITKILEEAHFITPTPAPCIPRCHVCKSSCR